MLVFLDGDFLQPHDPDSDEASDEETDATPNQTWEAVTGLWTVAPADQAEVPRQEEVQLPPGDADTKGTKQKPRKK